MTEFLSAAVLAVPLTVLSLFCVELWAHLRCDRHR
jgi:hypothetical protein